MTQIIALVLGAVAVAAVLAAILELRRDHDPALEQGLAWRCELCHDWRADPAISVRSYQIVLSTGVAMTRNVKYCNDRTDCIEGARDLEARKAFA